MGFAQTLLFISNVRYSNVNPIFLCVVVRPSVRGGGFPGPKQDVGSKHSLPHPLPRIPSTPTHFPQIQPIVLRIV